MIYNCTHRYSNDDIIFCPKLDHLQLVKLAALITFFHVIYDRTLIEHNTLTLSIKRLPKPALKKGSMLLCSILTYRNYQYASSIIHFDTEEIYTF